MNNNFAKIENLFFFRFDVTKKRDYFFSPVFSFHNLIKLEEIRKKLERKIYYNVIFCLLIYLYIQINIKFLSYLKYISFLTHTKKIYRIEKIEYILHYIFYSKF